MIPFVISPEFEDWLRENGIDVYSLDFKAAEFWAEIYNRELMLDYMRYGYE